MRYVTPTLYAYFLIATLYAFDNEVSDALSDHLTGPAGFRVSEWDYGQPSSVFGCSLLRLPHTTLLCLDYGRMCLYECGSRRLSSHFSSHCRRGTNWSRGSWQVGNFFFCRYLFIPITCKTFRNQNKNAIIMENEKLRASQQSDDWVVTERKSSCIHLCW